MNKIPNAGLIRAVLDGKIVQRKNIDGLDIWYDSDIEELVMNPDWNFRLKPERVTKEQALAAIDNLHVRSSVEILRRFIEETP